MKISKGLRQAYELQDFTFNAAMSLKESLTKSDKLKIKSSDATAIGKLVQAWELCQNRVRIHRGKPLPGSLRHDPAAGNGKRSKHASLLSSSDPIDVPAALVPDTAPAAVPAVQDVQE